VSWVAVVDLGSLSAQLLVTDGERRVRRSVDTYMDASTLSLDGAVEQRAIPAEALDRVGDALKGFRAIADDHGAAIRAVATAAARRAPNRDDLRHVVDRQLGVELTIIDEETEARLAFAGVGGDRSLGDGPGSSGSLVTIDVGGGSTDFGIGTATGLERAWSMPLGGSLVTRSYFHGDPPRPEELSAALSVVELHVDDLRRELPGAAELLTDPGTQVVGLGGVVTVAAVEVGLLDDDPLNGDGDGPLHGVGLTRDAVEDVFRTIATEARADRLHNPGLPAARVDDVVGGCAVLVEIMRQLDVETITVSQRGLADGVVVEWLWSGQR